MEPTTISARELREILFYVENQKMTVEELRHKLFDVKDQDKQENVDMGLFRRFEAASK